MSVLFVANLWKKLIVWAACVRDVHRTLDRLRVPVGGSGGPALAMKSPWERVQGFLLRSGADFEAHVDGR